MFDRTYCDSSNCKNKCGRKMAEDVYKMWQQFFPWRAIAMSNFCNDKGELIRKEENDKFVKNGVRS